MDAMLPSLISTCKRTLVCTSRSTDIVSNISFRAGAFTESIRTVSHIQRSARGPSCPTGPSFSRCLRRSPMFRAQAGAVRARMASRQVMQRLGQSVLRAGSRGGAIRSMPVAAPLGVVGARACMELVQDLGGLGERRTGSRRWFSDDSKKEEKPEKNTEEKGQKEGEAKGEGSDADDQAKLLEKLTAENKDLKDKVLYTLAEMENVRTIARRDMEQSRQFAIQSFAKQLLDVADNLGRAVESIPPAELEKQADNKLLATLLEGVRMTDTQLQKVFQANKIIRFAAPGDKFDPHLHDALFEYADANKEAGSIGQVLKHGYKLHDRVIRPAQVGTVKK